MSNSNHVHDYILSKAISLHKSNRLHLIPSELSYANSSSAMAYLRIFVLWIQNPDAESESII